MKFASESRVLVVGAAAAAILISACSSSSSSTSAQSSTSATGSASSSASGSSTAMTNVVVGSLPVLDTAGLQVIAAFVRERERQGRQVEWRGSAPALTSAAKLLGLSSFLKLS